MVVRGEIEVKVTMEGTDVAEFDDEDEVSHGPNTVSKYIQAVAGAKFEIYTHVHPNYAFEEDLLGVRIFLDGNYSGSRRLKRAEHNDGGSTLVISTCKSGTTSNSTLLRYRFADLETRDDMVGEQVETLKAKYDDLGTIKVTMMRKKDLGNSPSKRVVVRESKVKGAIPEKALKGRPLALATTLEPIGPAHRSKITYMTKDMDASPMKTFIFKYRSRKALQTLMLVPRTPSPVPLEERPVEELTRDELQQLVLRQRAQPAAVKQQQVERKPLKRERSASATRSPSRALKTSRTSGGTTIYHLDSDEEGEEEDLASIDGDSQPSPRIEYVNLLD